MRSWLALVIGIALTLPGRAEAQYKNTSFGLDAGLWLITKPSVVTSSGQYLPPDQRPMRLSNGVRLGGETNFKMDEDHIWFTGRVNVGFLHFPSGIKSSGTSSTALTQAYDYSAQQALGTLLGIQGEIGVRYVFLTDRFRPYLQFGLSYLRLMSFNSLASDGCDGDICGGASNNEAAFLTHPNVGGLHVEPGVELIFTRDIALHFFADVQQWLLFNATDNRAVVLGAGVVFFT